MDDFKANRCHVCRKVFCCVKCRSKHERNHHHIEPECNICLHGQAVLKNPTPYILNHIQSKHWPLCCLTCKLSFSSANKLLLHIQNPINNERQNFEHATPEMVSDYEFESPPIISFHKSIITSSNKYFTNLKTINSITTSTPMQRNDEATSLDKIQEVITPVDNPEKLKIAEKNTPLTLDDQKRTEPLLKRRVTFCESSLTDIKKLDGSKSCMKSTSLVKLDSPVYETNKRTEDIKEENKLITHDETEWETAINNFNSSKAEVTISFDECEINISLHQNAINELETSLMLESACTEDITESEDLAIQTMESISNFDQKPATIWSSVTNIVRSMVQGLSSSSKLGSIKKRCRSEDDLVEVTDAKRIKLNEIRCRKTIRELRPQYNLRRKATANKATQTELPVLCE